MNGRSLTVLVLAVFLGLGAMLVTRHLMSKPAAAEEESQEILVAAHDFKEEEVLKPDMVKTARKNKSAVPVGAFSSFKDVEERWVKTTMSEGDPIVEKKLGPKGSPPGLVANIPKGMRAYTVDVTEQSGVSGFISVCALPVQSFMARRPLQVSIAEPGSPVRLGLAVRSDDAPPGWSFY